jgi:hypothetical protein
VVLILPAELAGIDPVRQAGMRAADDFKGRSLCQSKETSFHINTMAAPVEADTLSIVPLITKS